MANRLFLHVGLPKSGTTYLQAVLAENKPRLSERSRLLYPGASWTAQVRAVRDVLSLSRDGGDLPADGAWRRLVDEVTAWDGDAVVSMEWLGSAEPHQARRVVETVAPATVEVIVTVRDLGRTLPAAWQEFLQNYEQWSWQEFLSSVTSEHPRGSPAGNRFWSQQDLGKVLATWSDVVPADQLHVVTLPRPGATAGELWSRFATVLELEPLEFDATGRGSNESLGLESSELLLRLNTVSRIHGLDASLYDEMFKWALAKRGLSRRRHRETAQVLPEELTGWVAARAAEQVGAIVASKAHIVGDLDDLSPVLDRTGTPGPASTEALLDAALDGLVALARDRGEALAKLRKRERRSAEEIEHLTKRLDDVYAAPLRAVLIAFSEKRPWLMPIRQRYSRFKQAREAASPH